MTAARTLRRPALLFGLAALAITIVCSLMVRSHLFRANPAVLAWGVTFDLTITIPALYWLTVVRGGRARPLTIAPLFVVCAAMAAAIIPRGEQAFLHQLRLVAAPLDLISIVLVGRKLLELRRSAAAAADDVEARIRVAAQSIFGEGVVAGAVASEISIVYYALFAWRKKAVVPHAARAVTVHEQSGWGSIVAGLLVVIAAESIGMHLLLQTWSATAAWIATALDAYGMLWLIGDYHALRLRPTLITSDSIEIRHGLRWSATIDRANIAAVARVQSEEEWKRRGTLKLALIDEPRFIIRLCHPVTATGILGMRKTIDSIAIRPDDVDTFIASADADSR